jgi:4-amino-4-deoxy-L-arabinose transferase-like glycosyltransferase
MSSAQVIDVSSSAVASSSRALEGAGSSLAERIAPWVAVVASVWFALAAAWGLFGPIPAGHYGTMGGEGIIGENMVRWHILGPVWDYVSTPPTPAQYYCHHPWGGFWIMGIVSAIFGHHDFVLPLPAVLMSAATPPLLYAIGRDTWGKVPGAAAAVGFVFLPITLGFANFHNVEVTVIFACVLFFWGHARMLVTWKRRYLAASLAGVALAASADWPAYLMLGTFLGVSLVQAFLLPAQWRRSSSFRRISTWWALSAVISVGLFCLWIGLFARSEKLTDLLSAASGRGMGSDTTTLQQALEGRKAWIEMSFTPLVIFLGKLAAPLALFRLLKTRRTGEAYSLSILVGAATNYVVFKAAADVHFFWSQYFGAYFALALAQLAATIGEAGKAIGPFVRLRRTEILTELLPLGLTILFAVAIFPDALRSLRYARETGGRFNENGTPIRSETNLIYLLKLLKDKLPPGTGPDVVSPDMQWLWNYGWASAGQGRTVGGPPTEHASPHDPHPIFVARALALTVEQQKMLVSTFHVGIYDDELWVVDRREVHAPIDAYSLNEREPSWFEWYFIGGVEPIRAYAHDAYSTWEWRTHFDQDAPLPGTSPQTLEQKRIAHNIAIASGDANKAAAIQAELEQKLSRRTARFPRSGWTDNLSRPS